jgi:uncharacterized protein DUF4760
MSSQTISSMIAIGGLVVNVIVLGFLIVQITLLRRQVDLARDAFVDEQRRSKKQATLDFMAATLDRRHQLHAKVPDETDRAATAQFLDSLKQSNTPPRFLFDYLNYYEVIAAGVNDGTLDLDIVDRTSGSTIRRIADTYRQFIEKRRQVNDQPTLYCELLALAETVQRRREGARILPATGVAIPST